MQELFNMAGLELPKYLATKKEENGEVPEVEVKEVKTKTTK